tara:strand:+ start:460 stop:972 length:513 start_codon:yes stop_codon:yes gene_type:complete
VTYFKKISYSFIIFLVFDVKIIFANELKFQSILELDKNIPKTCGMKIIVNEDFVADISIKKITKKGSTNTIGSFAAVSKSSELYNANLKTASTDLKTIIKNLIEKKPNLILMEGEYKENQMGQFFQELLIFGGELIINNSIYKINGPIDSKIRLEYLFCTGEMFHPKYKN